MLKLQSGEFGLLSRIRPAVKRWEIPLKRPFQEGDIVRNICVNIRFYEGWDE